MAELLQPAGELRRKRRRSAYDTPTAFKLLVGARLRQVREAAGVSLTDAATAMGYSQPVQLSVMEGGERLPTLHVLLQYAAAFDSTVDFLLGLSSDPEADPAVVIQRRLATDVAEELRLVLAKVAETSVGLARDTRPLVARATRLATAAMEASRALATVRRLNRSFDDDTRGGAGLVARIDCCADLALELLESATALQARAKGGMVGGALTQATLDEGMSLADVQALLSSGEPQSARAAAARAAALIGDADSEEGPDDAA